jgi:hypothetical protein
MELSKYDVLKEPMMWIKANKFKSDIEDFGTMEKKIDDRMNFKLIFKTLYQYTENFDNILLKALGDKADKLASDSNKSKKYIDEVIYDTIYNDLGWIEKEIMTIFPEHWKLLISGNGKTKIHIIYALIYVICEVRMKKEYISDYDENILLWAILLHDISKHVILLPEATEDFTERW